MSESRITSEMHSMKHVVVVGAGPVGLFMALRLKQIGVKNVSLVDKRIDEYVRSGSFEKAVYSEFQKMLNLPVVPSAQRHINLDSAVEHHPAV